MRTISIVVSLLLAFTLTTGCVGARKSTGLKASAVVIGVGATVFLIGATADSRCSEGAICFNGLGEMAAGTLIGAFGLAMLGMNALRPSDPPADPLPAPQTAVQVPADIHPVSVVPRRPRASLSMR